VLGNDITSPVAISEYRKLNLDRVFDKNKVTMVMDHFAPNKDIKAAEQCKMCRDFCNDMGIAHFFDVGEMGVEHAILPEKVLWYPEMSLRGRFPYLHIRRPGGVFHGRGVHRHGLRHGHGQSLVQSAARHQV
jgi:hypothetical protein